MTVVKKDQIRALLKSIETGDPGSVAVVNEAQYIQHNPQTHEGSEILGNISITMMFQSSGCEDHLVSTL